MKNKAMNDSKESRKSATIKTSISGVVVQVIATIFGFINQKIFINELGVEYSGIAGTFGNVLSILTLSDLGVSVAVIFHLYGALAKNDEDKIASLMLFYKKACRVISGIVICGGLILLPFAQNFVGETTVKDNIYVMFFLHILLASLQYAFNYRRVLLNADQKGYIINSVVSVSTFVLYIVKIIVLISTKNYYLYIGCAIVEKFLENTIIGVITKKKYKCLEKKIPLEKNIKKDIKKKIYASAYHNSASYIVNFTDNIIIAQLFGVATVGYYNNYYIIISAVNVLINQLLNGVVASLGNLLASSGVKKLYNVTKSLFFMNFWIYAVVAIAIYSCLPSFISLWIGPEYIIDNAVVIAIVLNFFISGMCILPQQTLNVAGIIYENRFIPVIEAIINLASSIILAKIFGLPGVFVGTILSSLFLHFFNYSKYVFNHVLHRKKREYILLFLKYSALFIVTWLCVGFTTSYIIINNKLIEFILRGMVSVTIPSLLYLLIFYKTEEFKYLYDIFIQLIKKKIRK